jgi:hypothetical protein
MHNRKTFIIFFVAFWMHISVYAQPKKNDLSANHVAALNYLDSVGSLPKSKYWQHINPKRFVENLRKNIEHPLFFYAGANTNFCSYAALSYSCLKYEPLRYVQFMIKIYKEGTAVYRHVYFTPSSQIKQAAGLLHFKGELDINHADQLWFLVLADHFKGYLNILSLTYKPGAEDKFWAATNFAKFNNMLRRMCNYEVKSLGSDIIRPNIPHTADYLREKLDAGYDVFLYLNNTILHKKNHNKIKKRIPTHFVVLTDIYEDDNDIVTLTYWDYGFKTLQQIDAVTFKKIIYGITWCKQKTNL